MRKDLEPEIKEKSLEIIEKVMAEGHFYINRGTYDGEELYIVESWECVYHLQGLLNGFEGLKNKPYLREGETYHSKSLELAEAIKKEPNHWGLKEQKEQADSWFFYKQYLAANQIEEIKLEDAIDFVFNDEYDICCDCYENIVRTSADSYTWTPPLFLEAEGYVCDCCAHKHKEDVLEGYKNEQKSIPDQFDPADLGLLQVNSESFENGWYGGQCDTPQPIIDALNEEKINCWFKVYPRQFDLDFDVYVKAEDLEKAVEVLNRTNTKAKEDPAIVLERGLRSATMQQSDLSGEGIRYTKINSDGTATTRLVSPDDFVKGIKD